MLDRVLSYANMTAFLFAGSTALVCANSAVGCVFAVIVFVLSIVLAADECGINIHRPIAEDVRKVIPKDETRRKRDFLDDLFEGKLDPAEPASKKANNQKIKFVM